MGIINNQQGQALLLTMIALSIIFFTSTACLYIAHNTRVDSILHRDKLQAHYVAEAGVEMVLARLWQDDNWLRWRQDFTQPISFAGGSCKISNVKVIRAGEHQQEIELTSTGYYRQAKKTLEIKVRLETIPESDEISMQIVSWRGEFAVF